MERINDIYARGNSFQGVVNNISESKKSMQGDKVNEMKFVKGAGNENKCYLINLPPPGKRPTLDELKNSIKEAMQTLSNKSPAVLALLVMMYEAFNKNNQALADINAQMAIINEDLMKGAAEKIKSKALAEMLGSIATSCINALPGVIGAKMGMSAAKNQLTAAKMDSAASAIPAGKTAMATDPAVKAPTVNGDVTDSTPSATTQLKKSIDVTVDTPDGSELRAKAASQMANSQILNIFSNIGLASQIGSFVGKQQEADQIMDENFAQVALTLFQSGATDSDSNKKYVEGMLQTILNIIENIVQARDTAAQNC